MNHSSSNVTFAVGTYTVLGGEGIIICSLNTRTLETKVVSRQRVDNPSSLCITPDGGHIYAVGESGSSSAVHHLTVSSRTSALTVAESVPAAHDPCHILMLSQRTIAIASYSDGAVELFDVAPHSGTLGKPAQMVHFDESGPSARQQSSHIHFCAITPDKAYLVADDLGGDCMHILKILRQPDGTARLSLHGKVTVSPGAGPRHICFSTDGKFAYLITELTDEVMAFAYCDGQLRLIQSVTVARRPAHASGHIMAHPGGKWLYASVRRADDGIATYHIEADGKLREVGYTLTGLHPRHFAITPCGTLLLCACRDSDTIEIYKINPHDGTLENSRRHIKVAKAVCIKFFNA